MNFLTKNPNLNIIFLGGWGYWGGGERGSVAEREMELIITLA